MPYLSALEVFHDEALYKYTFTFTFPYLGGFRDTYLGRKLFRGPEGRERGWGQLGSRVALRAPLAGSEAEP